MFLDEFKRYYKKIISCNGEAKQRIKCVEELAELTVELIREKGEDKGKIAGEIADVYNMLNQLLIIFDIPVVEIRNIMMMKNKRVVKRIDENDA